MASAAPPAAAASNPAAPGSGASATPSSAPGKGGAGESRLDAGGAAGGEHFDPVADVQDLFANAPYEHPGVDDTATNGEAMAAEAMRDARAEAGRPEAEEVAEPEAEATDGADPFRIGDLEFESQEAAAEAIKRDRGRVQAEAQRANRNAEAGQGWMDAAGQLAEALKQLGQDPKAILAGGKLPPALRTQPSAAAQPGATEPDVDAGDGRPFDFAEAAKAAYDARWFQTATESLTKAMAAGDDEGARQSIAATLTSIAQSNIALTQRAMEAMRQEFEQRLEPFEARDREAAETHEAVEAHKGLIKQVAVAKDGEGQLLFPDLFIETPQGPQFKDAAAVEAVRFINGELAELGIEPNVRNWAKVYAMHYGLQLLNGNGSQRGATVQQQRQKTAAGGDPTISGSGMAPLSVPRRGNGNDRDGMPAKASRSVMGVRQSR